MKAAIILGCLAQAIFARDLAPLFVGRTGAALVWDLKAARVESEWNGERARTRLIRPGSTLKPFTLATAIEAGIYRDGGEEAIATSSNEYFDKLAARLRSDELQRGYARFGLDSQSPTTTLQNLMQAGVRLVERHQQQRMRPVFAGMEQATEFGTARLAKIRDVAIAGKTGTTAGSALFFGYAPAAAPRYVVWIQLDSGSGGGDAAPFAAKIFSQLFERGSGPVDPSQVSVRLFWQNPPKQLNLKPGEYPAGTLIDTGITRMKAPGAITVRQNEIIAKVALEDYILAVLHGEAGGFRHDASRRAMAITARTYAARFRGRHAEEGFDFCDTTHCQDARFLDASRDELVKAVEATTGEILWYQGRPAAAYYHADSGGWLEGSSEGPYLTARRDPYWQDAPDVHWRYSIPTGKLANALNLTIVRPVFTVKTREASGRARAVDVLGHMADATALRNLVGRTLGWDKMPSRLFESHVDAGLVYWEGRGRGHGIGLPQRSAEAMAQAGKSTDEILKVYFPGTRVGVGGAGIRWSTLSEGSVTLRTTNISRDAGLLGAAQQELEALTRMTGWTATPVLRVFPSREAFRDVTGISAPVLGATRGRNIYFPAPPPRATLRHELLHAIIESNAAPGHPEWLREGLVQALLGESSPEATRAQLLLQQKGLAAMLTYLQKQPSKL